MDLILVVLGGALAIAGGWAESYFRSLEQRGKENRDTIRRFNHAVFTMLCVRDQVEAIRSGLELLPRLLEEEDDPAKEEKLRLHLMQSNRDSATSLITEMEPALAAVSEVNPFLANRLRAVANGLRQTVEQDYTAVTDNPMAYEGFRRTEHARVLRMRGGINQALRELAQEADIDASKMSRVIQGKDAIVKHLEEGVEHPTSSALAEALEGGPVDPGP